MLVNCVLIMTGAEAKETYMTEKFCGGLEAGDEGGMHAVRILWQQHSQEEDWGFLLIDACNAINEYNRT